MKHLVSEKTCINFVQLHSEYYFQMNWTMILLGLGEGKWEPNKIKINNLWVKNKFLFCFMISF